jgi:hypothetical protein
VTVDLSTIVADLRQIGPRAACSDAERRAARLLMRELRTLDRRARMETFWARPQVPAVWLLHALLGVAGSVVSVGTPAVAVGVLAVAALSGLLELGGRGPGLSLLWPRRATQNVVSDGPGQAPVRLVVTAAYDSPRSRSGFAAPLVRLDAALRRATRGRWPSPLALLTLSLVALVGCAGARLGGIDATWLGAIQLLPTVACITATAILADLALAGPAPSPNLSDSAPAAALALVAELDRRPPRRLEVDVVLAGAGGAMAVGMRGYVRRRRRDVRPEDVAALHLEPCGSGNLRVWRRDGPLLSLALHPDLVAAAVEAGFAPYDGRGVTGALVARRARWPAVAVGRLDERERPASSLDDAQVRATVEACVRLVRHLDARVPVTDR